MQGIVDLTLKVKDRLNRYAPGGEVQGSVTPHVPKSHTPFQWAPMYPLDVIEERVNYLRKALRSKGVVFKIDSPKWLRVQGVLARGDRRLSAVLANMEGVSHADWKRAMDEAGLTEDFYARERPTRRAVPLVAHRGRRERPRARHPVAARHERDARLREGPDSWATRSATCIEFHKTGDAGLLRVAR